jgi:hypothetical protein
MTDTITMTAPDWVQPTDVTHVKAGESAGAYEVRKDRTITHVAPEHVPLLTEAGYREVKDDAKTKKD